MFNKPFESLKASAPLRSSDRRKLKQRVIRAFSLDPDVGEDLVPDGLLSVKFRTHIHERGVAYLGPNGDPLWFTLGRDSEDLIPTVYALWKKPDLLPCLSTPSAVIPDLVGTDLVIPRAVRHAQSLQAAQLVSITGHIRDSTRIGPPHAVGRVAVSSGALSAAGAKGKAVFILHAWNDHLFGMGHKCNPPDPAKNDASKEPSVAALGSTQLYKPTPTIKLTKEDVSTILHAALLQAIKNMSSSTQTSVFPMSASTLYSTYILPSRPASSPSQPTISTPIDIKHSSHKSLAYFLKSAEKQGLLKLKEIKSELMVFSVTTSHTDVIAHRPYISLKDEFLRNKQREEEKQAQVQNLEITKLHKPHLQSLKFFSDAGFDTSTLFTHTDIKAVLDKYVRDRRLVNVRDPSYINVGADELLRTTIWTGGPAKMEFLKRDKVIEYLSHKMQNWYKIRAEGRDPVFKEGQLEPILVEVKIVRGRRACTLITGFEPFLFEAVDLAKELRTRCASSTSVSSAPGKSPGMKVFVQGKQIKAVTAFLASRGVPQRWVRTVGGGKK
ncbi:uncharacterized protein EDB91DRAFT_840487 [Suillus paluster]|uniref:uncharacterized protein n=1 Tax=Suillus paluster TaxID=48578 RepID=UPI001B87D190|nr:uncharacterized protein EDB91DRAFT_840487 [Suillus paluster]KAG1728967.1 hypothetical protein EDB91DRAFT_840487 [Suillus paluster]